MQESPIVPGLSEPAVPMTLVRRAFEDLAANAVVALKVIAACDDDRSSARSVGELIERDPILTVRVLRAANSAVYALRSPATNPHRAVAVLGFGTVKALAAVAACGPGAIRMPEDFWRHSGFVAVAARTLAPEVGVDPDDAFATGLLHELGVVLLQHVAPKDWEKVAASKGDPAIEREVFGTTHGSIAAEMFRAWRFPDEMCLAIAGHAGSLWPLAPPLQQVLAAAEGLADHHLGATDDCRSLAGAGGMAALGIDEVRREQLLTTLVAQASEIVGALAP